MKRKPRAVLVEWDDHAFTQGTLYDDALEELQLTVQSTVGWLVMEDADVVAVAQTVDDLEQVQDVILIDKRMIRRRRYLKGAE